MTLFKNRYITRQCKECETLLLEMLRAEQIDCDAIDCCLRRLYRIRYTVAPFWKKSKVYLD